MRRAAIVFLAVWVGVGPGTLSWALGRSRWCCPPPCVPCPPVECCVPAPGSCEGIAPSAKPTPAEPEPVVSTPAVDSPPLVARPEQPAAFAPPEAPATAASATGESEIEPLAPPPAAAERAPATPVDEQPPPAPLITESEPSRYGATPAADSPSFTQPSDTAFPAAGPTTTPAADTTPGAEAESMFDAPPNNRYAPPTATPSETTTPAEAAPPVETQPEPMPTEPAPAEPEEEDIFDLGQSRRVLDEPGGLSSQSVRQWNDAAGQHSCEARLAAVSADGVVLDRADGGEAQVAFQSLSEADLQFVRRQIHARQLQLAAENAAIAASPGQ